MTDAKLDEMTQLLFVLRGMTAVMLILVIAGVGMAGLRLVILIRLSDRLAETIKVVESHTTILQQYSDLLAHQEQRVAEGAEKVTKVAAELRETVRDPAGSGTVPKIDPKAVERHERYEGKKANGGAAHA